ncbi:hypothetical protein B9Q01_03385 [Candidatus Marsarchaeota G1 archaeon OSP_D]|uniref:DUF4162 domain-containing protein n=5 Tax=Candidatus Marsarchaeota TaxID=1978152 RepID=A0A2R6C1S5_9ARCH|nr:MAG: hypothetical protein B9Q01_03385 [Candidatus Marsarchaeota G1 archaeon OSP_D]PSN84687.1 MAG: hypothetical protein B9Q02_09180 [Candidatus Marsarchaeota G1 archaeon BE_D]PSN87440.1 MAG: hypothetical protein B9Q00_08820 [Candidatus Marsarchaeota G1 archaeon OSP_C]PSO03657.1 MAG: hypothetical protein B9Q10_00185 [Candidatus Marsarchaeota G2 archaeon ECH_B_SAG-E12]PSO04696.1 MAG: hypothetical protein B9Q12_01940 [Candidatus Marsarchaeota G2 archaeon ECH_B_SAG-G06]
MNAKIEVDKNSCLVVTEDPKSAIQTILEGAQRFRVQIEWLNVRKNTLEEVFMSVVANGEKPWAS